MIIKSNKTTNTLEINDELFNGVEIKISIKDTFHGNFGVYLNKENTIELINKLNKLVVDFK